MKVLVATTHTQGEVDTDYSETVEGELVLIPGDCLTPDCTCERGCDPSFYGVSSGQRTTTAMIVDRPELNTEKYASLIADGLRKLDIISPTCPGCENCEWDVEGHLLDLDFLVGPGFVGEVVARLGCDFSRRTRIDPASRESRP